MAVRPTFRITEIHHVQFEEARSVRVIGEDTLRGTVEIELDETGARWLWACLDPKVQTWRKEDDALAERLGVTDA